MSPRSKKELAVIRLKFISDTVNNEVHYTDILRLLISNRLVSEYYDETCLTVDIWYLYCRKPVLTYRKIANIIEIKDPIIRLFMGVVIRAIQDVKNGRPCDFSSWRGDKPPDKYVCSPTEHVCRDHALDFLEDTSLMWEDILNLPHGTLVNMATKENGSARSRSLILRRIGLKDE